MGLFRRPAGGGKGVQGGARGSRSGGVGHVVTELLDALRAHEPSIDEALLDRARALDKLYIPTRYPNGLAGGAPADFYTRPEAERAIADAEAVLAICRRVLSRP